MTACRVVTVHGWWVQVEGGNSKSGGVVYVANAAQVTLTGTRLTGNSVRGVCLRPQRLVTPSHFWRCAASCWQADIGGVGTLIQTGKITCVGCTFVGNRALQRGGVFTAVGSSAATITDLGLFQCTFRSSSVSHGDGGAVALELSASAEFQVWSCM